jgi:hypothetical protein
MDPDIHCEHFLLWELRQADREAARRLPWKGDSGLGAVGLIFTQELTPNYYYWCTPVDCWTFAHTGGDGVHFSLLAKEGLVADSSPVVITNPSGGMGLSHIVGEDLFDFLCLGSMGGYFGLEELAYNLDATLQLYVGSNEASGRRLSEHKQKLLSFLRDQFDLQPWSDSRHFGELQERYGGLLELPPPP